MKIDFAEPSFAAIGMIRIWYNAKQENGTKQRHSKNKHKTTEWGPECLKSGNLWAKIQSDVLVCPNVCVCGYTA